METAWRRRGDLSVWRRDSQLGEEPVLEGMGMFTVSGLGSRLLIVGLVFFYGRIIVHENEGH